MFVGGTYIVIILFFKYTWTLSNISSLQITFNLTLIIFSKRIQMGFNLQISLTKLRLIMFGNIRSFHLFVLLYPTVKLYKVFWIYILQTLCKFIPKFFILFLTILNDTFLPLYILTDYITYVLLTRTYIWPYLLHWNYFHGEFVILCDIYIIHRIMHSKWHTWLGQ